MSLQCEASQPAFMTSEHSIPSLLNPEGWKEYEGLCKQQKKDGQWLSNCGWSAELRSGDILPP